MPEPAVQSLPDDLQPASQGKGPLLQRDYWAVIRDCRLSPTEVISLVRERFDAFPPKELVRFKRKSESSMLEVGNVLEIDLGIAGRAGVRVVHADAQSVTLATLQQHPEAGRITFGAYRNRRGDVIFHIRSRARSCSLSRYVGFVLVGDAMQTNTWTDFVDRLANCVGDGVVGAIQADIAISNDEDGLDVVTTPTFRARGD